MSDEQDRLDVEAEERRLGALFALVQAPESLRGRWRAASAVSPGIRERLGGAVVGPRGDRRLRPLAAALVLPVAVLAIAGGAQFRAHFSHTASGVLGTPAARSDAAMAYDPVREVTVMFGGRSDAGDLGDTWTWDGRAWRQQHPAVSPPAREGAGMAFDRRSGRVLMVGGWNSTYLGPDGSGETWSWDGSTWRREQSARGPALSGPLSAVASDPESGQVVLVAFQPQTLGVPPEAAPVPQPIVSVHVDVGVPASPPVVGGAPPKPPQGAAVPVPITPVVPPTVPVMPPVRSDSHDVDTWTWSGSDWTRVAMHTHPTGMLGQLHLAYDGGAHRLTLFAYDPPQCGYSDYRSRGAAAPSGQQGYVISEAPCRAVPHRWPWDGRGWSGATIPVTGPRPPAALTSAPDGQGLVALEDASLWLAKAGRTTGYRKSPVELNGRTGVALATDTDRHVVVLFGGHTQYGLVGETWEWDGMAWTRRDAAPSNDLANPPAGATPHPCSLVIPRVSERRLGSDAVRVTVEVDNQGGDCGPGLSVRVVSPGGGSRLGFPEVGLPVRSGSAALVWRNWCEDTPASIAVWWTNSAMEQVMDVAPSCTDRSKPPTLALDR